MNTKKLNVPTHESLMADTDTQTVTLDSAELCGDPHLTVNFTLSSSTTSTVTVLYVQDNTTGYMLYANTPATSTGENSYTATFSVPGGNGGFNVGDSTDITVQVGETSAPPSNPVEITGTMCKE